MRRTLLAFLLASLATAGDRRPLTPADVYAIREVGEMQISPDGRNVLFTEITRDTRANRVITRLMQVPTAGGKVTVVPGAPEDVSNVRWSPDSSRVALIAGHEKSRAIWVLAPHGGKPLRVCDYDKGNSFLSKAGNALAWSPDGSRLAFAGTPEPSPARQDPLVIGRIQYKTRTEISDNRRSHIYVVPATGGSPRALTSGRFDEHSIDWGGDGSEIVFLSNREPDPDANLNYDIFAVKVATGAVRRITRTPGVEMEPSVSPDGRWIACIATRRALTTIDSVAEDAHVWLVPFGGGAGRELNAALDRRSSSPKWSPDGRAVLYTVSDRGKIGLYRVPVAGGESTALIDRAAQVGPFSVARDGTLVFALTDAVTPQQIFRLGRDLETLTSANSEEFELTAPEQIRFPSFDGQEIEGWLYLPGPASGRLPMILSIHGGPHGMYGYAFSGPFQLHAARGYATLILNPRGSSGYGQKFSDGCVNNWGGGDYQDLMAGVDYVLKTHPQLDAARLGVMGGSYGGFMTNWVITQTPRFKAAVATASLSNLISFYATSLYQDLIHAEFGGFPWEDDHFALLWKWSPLHYVKNVVTPTLFLHGEQDNDVHITQAEEMYTALRRRGVETLLVRYPREGHGFHEPKHQLDALERSLAWMDRFLK